MRQGRKLWISLLHWRSASACLEALRLCPLVAVWPRHANLGCVHRLGDVLPLRRQGGGTYQGVTNNIFGAIMALIALLLVTQIPLGGALGVPLWAAICVLITVFILVYAAKAPMLSDIPAGVLGYAAVAGLALTGNSLARSPRPRSRTPLLSAYLADYRRGARIHFPEVRAGARQGIIGPTTKAGSSPTRAEISRENCGTR